MEKQSTKEKILKAAQTLFVEQGFAGASIGNIAKLAAVNHSLVFHHFKNKDQLWIAVKQNIVSKASKTIKNLPDSKLPLDEFLTELFHRNLRFYRDNRDIMRMLNWQRLEQGSLHKIGLSHSNDMQDWILAIEHYQQAGAINKQYKPAFVVTMILSIISSAALDPNVFIEEKQDLDQYIKFSVLALMKALS